MREFDSTNIQKSSSTENYRGNVVRFASTVTREKFINAQKQDARHQQIQQVYENIVTMMQTQAASLAILESLIRDVL